MTAALEGGEWSAARPGRTFTPGKDSVPIVQETGWAPGQVWTGGKSRSYRDSIPGRPARSQSLYRLSYPSSYSFCHDIEVLLVNCKIMENCPPILFPSPYLSQHFSGPHSKKPPPKQISGHSSHTKNIIITFNGVPLDTYNASFVQLSERCKRFCSHSRLFSRKST